MKTNRLIKYFLLLVLFGFGISCENENGLSEPELEQEEPIFFHNFVKLDDILDVNDYLSSKTGVDITSKGNGFNGAIFDTENILQVVDTLDNTNYSFGFTFPDTDENVFYNLIVGVDANGNKGEPFVIKYISELEHLDYFRANGSNFHDFIGDIQLHRYTDYFDEGTFAKNECETQFDAVGDPLPCYQGNVGSGSSGGSASTGGDAPGATGSWVNLNGGDSGFNAYYDSCHCHNNLIGDHDHKPTTFVIDLKGRGTRGGTKKSALSAKSDCDCVFVSTTGPNLLKSVEKLKLMVGLSNDQAVTLQNYPSEASRMLKLLTTVDKTQAENEIKMQIARLKSKEDDKLVESSGKIANNEALAYTHRDTKFDNGQGVLYQLANGLFIAEYPTKRGINGGTIFDQDISLSHNGKFYYAYNPDQENDYGSVNGHSLGWYEVVISQENNGIGFESAFVDALWDGAKFVGRYVLPVEDVLIMIDGKDFDGVEQSRVQAAGFFVVGLIPGGKITKAFKPIAKIVSGISEYRKIVKVGTKNLKLPLIKVTNGIVDFGTDSANRSALRKVLQLTTGDGKHAHHIIPWEFRDFDLIQKAAKSDNTFHISEKLNGIPLPSSNHLNGHPSYNLKVGEILNQLNVTVGSNENAAFEALEGFIGYLDNLIRSNPNKNLGQIADLISYP